MADEIQKSINKAIDTIIKNRINALALDKTVIAIIDALIDPVMNIYRVQYDGGYFNAVNKQTNSVYRRGMSVYVQIPQNDMTKEKIIIGRAYATKGSELANSVISAINSYSIMGGNLLKTTENKLPDSFALRSYHDKRYENIIDSEGNIHHPTSHRAQYFLGDTITRKDYYDLDNASLDIYKESATGLMLQADFRTALSTEQKNQVSGSYGLVLNLVFENSSYQYGETEEEIFNYFAKDIKVENVLVLNPEEDAESEFIAVSKSVADYANDFRNDINFSGTEEEKKNKVQNLLKTDGLIDMYISYIESITNVYSQANPQLFLPEADAAINSFIQMLKDIKAIFTEESSLADIYEEYKNWADLTIAPPAEKNISYVLDSNHMTGAPFYFSSWSTQYEIFDIDFSTFKRIDSILFYKDGFISDNAKDERIGDDIFVKDLKIYALQPISAINGDYSLKLNAPDGYIFPEEVLEEESPIKLKAQVFKQYMTDLSDQVAFQWFKANPAITSVGHDDYRPYGGLGWKYLERKGNKKNFEVTRSENVAYENKYKCVAIVDSSVVLSQEFTIYNEAVSDNIVITSDQGTLFSFDSGMPLLTACFYDRKQSEETGEKVYEERVPTAEAFTNYTYQWAIVVNGQRTFLDKFKKDINASLSIQDNMTAQNLATLINGVKFYRGETLIETTDEIKYATRMLYPVRNIAFESNAIFECYIQDNNEEKGSASLAIQNQAQGAAVDYKITIEGGEQIFQYDEYGGPPNDKKLKTPQEIKPLICHFFNPTGLEVGSGSYHVEWIVPIENTLITTNTVLQSNPLNNYVFEIDPNQQCSFGIAELYDESCQNNQIVCRVTYNDKTFTQSTNMFFGKVGSNGTNGTDVVLKIEPTSTIPLLDNQPLTLYRSEWDEELSKYTVLTLNDGTIVRNGDLPLSATDDVVNHLRARLFQKNDEIAVTRGTIKWNVAGSTQTTANNVGKYLKTKDGALIWSEDFQKNKQDNFVIRAWIRYLNKDYYGFYNLSIIEYTDVLPRVSRISIDKKFLLKDIIYNADGRNPIYSHTQGVKINNIPAGGYIVWEAIGGIDDNQEDCFFSLLENKDSNQGVKEIAPIWKCNDTDEVVEEFTDEITQEDCYIAEYPPEQVYILPYDEYDGGYCNNRVVAKVYRSNNTLLAKVIVPIHMSLNTFGLASLNAWDGTSVTIDYEDKYIMAPQIGAGEKDDNNRFTGVVMGKAETYTGRKENERQIGLLGYSHGLQSIFLDAETGEATFGLPGGKILTEEGNTLVPINGDDYGEGRVELRPGGISKIGGWQFGKRSLYYTAEGSTITDRYRYSGKLLDGGYHDKDSVRHVKDIKHDEQGILISADPPYMSIKGRTLTVDDFKDVDTENRQVFEGESLELQLDPDNIAMFAIYRHFKNAAKDNAWDREMISGINAKGQLVANKMQQVPIDDSSAASSTLGIDALTAFEGPNYIGLNLTAGANSINSNLSTFFRAFVNQDDIKGVGKKSASETPLYITGGQFGSKNQPNDYTRPISIHGKTVSLWASSVASNGPTTDNYVYVGNNEGFIGIKNLGTSYYWTRKDGVAIPGTPVYNVYDLYNREQWWFDKETGNRVFPRQFNFDNNSLWKQYKLYINKETGEEIVKGSSDIPPTGFPYKIRKTGPGSMDYEYVLDNNGERIRVWILRLIYKDLTITNKNIYWYEKITYIWSSDNQEHDDPPSTGEYEILRMYWSYPDGDSEYPPEAYYNLYTLKTMYVRNNERPNITGLPASTENPIKGWNRIAKVNGTYNRSNSSFLFINQRTSDPGDEISGSLLHTSNRLDIQSNSGIINIIARGVATGTRKITLQANNSSNPQTPLTKLELINASDSGNNGIVADTQGKVSLTAKGNIELIRDTNSYLKIQGDTIDLRTADNNNRLYLKNDVDTNSSLTTKGNLNIVSNNNTITIKTKGAVSSPAIYLSANTTSGFENYLKMWANVGSYTQSLTLFKLHPEGFNPIQYQSGAKPGVTTAATNDWVSDDTYGFQTSALVIGKYGETGYYGGLASAWGYFSGKMYGADKYTSNENLVNASLYSKYGIHGGTWIKANDSIITGDDFKFSSSWDGNGSEQTEDGNGHVGTAEKTYNASGSTFKGLIQQANNRAAAAYVHLPKHNHSFSKGITVKVSEGDSNGVSVTQGSAGSNATINVTVKPILIGTSTYVGGEFKSASVTFSHENYQRAGITAYTKGAESTKDPGYYQVQPIPRDIYYKADNGSSKITISPQSTSHSGDLNIIKVTNFSHDVSEVTVQDNHAATITNFSNNKHSISGISDSAGSN